MNAASGDGGAVGPTGERPGADDALVMRMLDDSMHPGIKRGAFFVVEPNGRCVLGEYVLIRKRDGRRVVRELVTDGAAAVVVEAVNGNARQTIERSAIEAMWPVVAIVSASTAARLRPGQDREARR